MKNYFEKLRVSLNDSIDSLDCEAFNALLDDAERTLRAGKKIVASGLGKNVPICDKFVGTMVSLGLDAAFLHTNSAVHGDLGVVHEGDLVILLTKSGATAESVYLYDHLLVKGANIWLLTFNADSVLGQRVDQKLVIRLDHEGDKWDIVPNNSTTLNLIVLQALAIQLSERLDVALGDFKVNHPGGHIGVQLNGE